jgi:hypothetical protein
MYQIFKEFSKFNNIKFYDEPHVYFIDDEQVISVTGLIHKFENAFEEEKWLNIKAEERVIPGFKQPGESDEEALERAKKIVKAEWTFKNNHGIYEGKLTHFYLENLMANKDVTEDVTGHGVVPFDEIENTYYVIKKHAYSFYRDYVLTGILIPVKSELVVGAKELKLAGQIDQLFYNTQLDALQLYDWKTNRKLGRTSNYSMTGPLSHLDSCELNTYSLQLYTYKYLLEKNTNIRLHEKLHIVWLNEHNDGPHVIECRDMTKEVQMMLDYKEANPDMFKVRPYVRPGIPEIKVEKATPMGDLLNFNDPFLF